MNFSSGYAEAKVTFPNNFLRSTQALIVTFFGLIVCATAMARTITFVPQSLGFDSQGYGFAEDAQYGIALSCVDELGAPKIASNGSTQFGKISQLLVFDGLPTNSVCDFLLIPPNVPKGLEGAFDPAPGKARSIALSETFVSVKMELYLPKTVGVTLVLDVPPELATLSVSAELNCYAVAVKNRALVNGARLELRSVPKNAYCSIYVDDSAIK